MTVPNWNRLFLCFFFSFSHIILDFRLLESVIVTFEDKIKDISDVVLFADVMNLKIVKRFYEN